MKVFLGGVCNGSTWRNKLISLLKKKYKIHVRVKNIEEEKPRTKK